MKIVFTKLTVLISQFFPFFVSKETQRFFELIKEAKMLFEEKNLKKLMKAYSDVCRGKPFGALNEHHEQLKTTLFLHVFHLCVELDKKHQSAPIEWLNQRLQFINLEGAQATDIVAFIGLYKAHHDHAA